jgi:squalene-hopene/tetraprenyl-beta-curcumene cyclase
MLTVGAYVLAMATLAGLMATRPRAAAGDPVTWNPKAAAAYLDQRQDWWQKWPSAARDRGTFCVSCHTAATYALGRPALRGALHEAGPSASELALQANVTKRVTMWKDVEPFYPDQTRGLPKTSESRGTEAILNALILSGRDARGRSLGDDTRRAFDNLWALQFTKGEQSGGWAWLNFHYEPWEAEGSAYYGAALAAIAIGVAPGGYAASAEIQDRMKLLRDYLSRSAGKQHLFNRVTLLWASTTWSGAPGGSGGSGGSGRSGGSGSGGSIGAGEAGGAGGAILTPEDQRAIVDDLLRVQQDDGGWSMASLGSWKRVDNTPNDIHSDGYATGLVAYVLQAAADPRAKAQVSRALAWLVAHQDPATGAWFATSLNKQRDPASDAGRFMNDAATAYAVLALTKAR